MQERVTPSSCSPWMSDVKEKASTGRRVEGEKSTEAVARCQPEQGNEVIVYGSDWSCALSVCTSLYSDLHRCSPTIEMSVCLSDG